MRLAARAGWRAVSALARVRVVQQRQALQAARGAARTAAPGIAIRVSGRHLGPRMWTLRVTGRRGRRRASASAGRGWFGRDQGRRAWYSAAPDQALRHRRILEGLRAYAARDARTLRQRHDEPRVIHREMVPDLAREEHTPNPRPLGGVTFDIAEREYHDRALRSGDTELRYRVTISPNASQRWFRVTIPALIGPENAPTLRDVQGSHPPRLHPYLRRAGIPDLHPTPYRLFPAQREFRLRMHNDPGITDAMWWEFSKRRHTYLPERRRWATRGGNHYGFVPSGVQSGRKSERIAHARRSFTAGVPAAGAVMNAIARHREGDHPRPFHSLAHEQRHPVIRPHALLRHVLIGPGIQSTRDLAVRAAFHVLPGGRTSAPGALGQASAWRTLRAADAECAAHIAVHLGPAQWPATRRQLIRSRVFEQSRPLGSRDRLIAYMSRNGGAIYPPAERPYYLRVWLAGRFGLTGAVGTRRLIPADSASPLWLAAPAAYRSNAPSLTAPSTAGLTQAFLRVSASAAIDGGWAINTFFPS